MVVYSLNMCVTETRIALVERTKKIAWITWAISNPRLLLRYRIRSFDFEAPGCPSVPDMALCLSKMSPDAPGSSILAAMADVCLPYPSFYRGKMKGRASKRRPWRQKLKTWFRYPRATQGSGNRPNGSRCSGGIKCCCHGRRLLTQTFILSWENEG